MLGRGKPGGVWQSLDSAAGSGDMLTVSLGGWMELPQLSMTQWRDQATDRATVAAVSRYYEDYVASMGLGGNFRSHTTVTGVREVTCPAPAPAPASCPAPSISLTLCLLGTGGLLPFVTTPAFRMPFGPLTSSVVLPLLLVCFSFGLSDPEDR